MPITIRPSTNIARAKTNIETETSSEKLLQKCCPREYKLCNEVIESSFGGLLSQGASISSANNGFFRACHEAYSSHHHLTIRPEDVWFCILSQLSFYINAHAEELRSFFVEHEGQKELEVWHAEMIGEHLWGSMAVQMTNEIQKNVIDPDLRDWVMPNFSTTTDSDQITAAILFMGAMQKYFSYRMGFMCGMPSVTLLGEKLDWEKIRKRLDMLIRLGPETGRFASVLKPVLNNFVASFDDPEGIATVDFWSKMIHHHTGSGISYYSGWISAFGFWRCDGTCLDHAVDDGPVALSNESTLDFSIALERRLNTCDIPDGFVSVPVTIDDDGHIYKSRMVAGVVGLQWTSSCGPVEAPRDRRGRVAEQERHQENDSEPTVPSLDSVAPLTGWWMYELQETSEGPDPEYGITKPALPKNKREPGQIPFWKRIKKEQGVQA